MFLKKECSRYYSILFWYSIILNCAFRGKYKNAKIKTNGGSKTTDATRWQKFPWSIQYTYTGESLVGVTTSIGLILFKDNLINFKNKNKGCICKYKDHL